MLIIGAKGFAKEVLTIFSQSDSTENIFFYDDITENVPLMLYGQFPVLRNMNEVIELFEQDKRFTLGIGNPKLRYDLYRKFSQIGGVPTSVISPFAHVGKFGNTIGNGVSLMTGTIVTNDVKISDGALINLNCTIGHNSCIGRFAELSPGVHISGNCFVGDFSIIGTGAVILPKIKVGNNVVVGAGAVVRKDVEDNICVAGVPAKFIKKVKT
jgi:sugar O-acyltransferase (sialic acid O-acetyltransferase NeuD family)